MPNYCRIASVQYKVVLTSSAANGRVAKLTYLPDDNMTLINHIYFVVVRRILLFVHFLGCYMLNLAKYLNFYESSLAIFDNIYNFQPLDLKDVLKICFTVQIFKFVIRILGCYITIY